MKQKQQTQKIAIVLALIIIISLITPIIVSAEISNAVLEEDVSFPTPRGHGFIDNGSKFYLVDNADRLREYNLTEPWNISTAVHHDFIILANKIYNGLRIKPDGTVIIISDGDGDVIEEYTLSTPYDVSTITLNDEIAVPNNPHGIEFNPDGTQLLVTRQSGSNSYIREYSLSTGWDLSTASFVKQVNFDSNVGTIRGVSFNSDGSKILINDAAAGSEAIEEYDLSERYNISTATHVDQLTVTYEPADVNIGNNDTNFYIGDFDNGQIKQYGNGSIEATPILSGFVFDTDGNPIQNANITTNVSTVNTTTDVNGFYELELSLANHNITASADGFQNSTRFISLTQDTENFNFTLETRQFQLNVPSWMERNGVAAYTTSFISETGSTDVTSQSNVRSNNTSVIVINTTSQQLEAQNVNNSVIIEANFTDSEGTFYEDSATVVVSDRTLEHIGILPPETWIGAIIGIDDPGVRNSLGSNIQYLFFVIIMMALFGYLSRNPFIGIGTGVILLIVLWVAEFLPIAYPITGTFFGIFIALAIMELYSNGE